MSAGSKPDLLLEIDLHDRQEPLLVGLLVDLDLDVAGLHLLDDLRREVEPAEQDLAGRNAAVLQHAGHVRVP